MPCSMSTIIHADVHILRSLVNTVRWLWTCRTAIKAVSFTFIQPCSFLFNYSSDICKYICIYAFCTWLMNWDFTNDIMNGKIYFNGFRTIIQRKFQQWWSTIPPISAKRTTTSYPKSLNITILTSYHDSNPGPSLVLGCPRSMQIYKNMYRFALHVYLQAVVFLFE